MDTYLDTWSGFEAAKTAPWPVWDSTTSVNSLSPQMSKLVEDAVASRSTIKYDVSSTVNMIIKKYELAQVVLTVCTSCHHHVEQLGGLGAPVVITKSSSWEAWVRLLSSPSRAAGRPECACCHHHVVQYRETWVRPLSSPRPAVGRPGCACCHHHVEQLGGLGAPVVITTSSSIGRPGCACCHHHVMQYRETWVRLLSSPRRAV